MAGSVNYYDYGTDYVGTPTAIFSPSGTLSYATTYTLTTVSALATGDGEVLAENYIFKFTTADSSGAREIRRKTNKD